MNNSIIRILNIGLDRSLLSSDLRTEAQDRQLFYAKNLPAKITHIVKAPLTQLNHVVEIEGCIQVFPCKVWHWLAYIPKSLALAVKLIKSNNILVIQTQDPFVCGLAGFLLSKITKLPLVIGVYSDEIDNPEWIKESSLNFIFNIIGKFILSNASGIRTDSYDVFKRLQPYKFKNLFYIPFLITNSHKFKITNSIEVEKIRKRFLGDKKGPLLLFVGRLESEKNIPLILNSFARLKAAVRDAALVIIGDGSLANKLKEQSKSISDVYWVGWVENIAVPIYYQAADLLLVSSYRESAARVLYESSLSGTAVLTTATAGAEEVIINNVSGKVVPVYDSEAFNQALLELSSDLGRLKILGENAKKITLEKVSEVALINELRRFYKESLGSEP
jgi:glycosyltransferase involved in cell wall biosynthesis